jgi:hypothetical protein
MNPNWLPAVATAIGVVVNMLWTAYNVQRRNDLDKLIAELKLWMSDEYVSEKNCRQRMLLDVQPSR